MSGLHGGHIETPIISEIYALIVALSNSDTLSFFLSLLTHIGLNFHEKSAWIVEQMMKI